MVPVWELPRCAGQTLRKGGPVLRVMTWNLWWRFGPWWSRQAVIGQVVADQQADLLGLQEVWVEESGANQAEVLAKRLSYHWRVGELHFRDGVAFTNAILSRWPILSTFRARLPDAAGGLSHRQVLGVRVTTGVGPVLFVTTHLDWAFDASPTRRAQLQAVCQLIDSERADPLNGYPAILTGDLNATPHSDELRMMTGAAPVAVPGLTFVDAWEVAGGGQPGHTWNGANPYLAEAAYPNRRLDYVLVSWPRRKPLGSVAGVWMAGVTPVEGVTASDHYAVVADLR